MALSGERCQPCEFDFPVLSADEEAELVPFLSGWEILTNNESRRLVRSYPFDGWLSAIEFASLIAAQAEFEDHHPMLTITWGRVTVTWWTHVIGGLHRNDFIMASRTDHIFEDCRPRR